MKRLLFLLLLTLIDIEYMHYSLNSCPSCIGNASEVKTPFFCDECYQEQHLLNLSSLDLSDTTTNNLIEEGQNHE